MIRNSNLLSIKKLKEKHDEKQSETRITVSNFIASARNEQVPININQANTQDISLHKDEAIEREIVDSRKQFNQILGVEEVQVDDSAQHQVIPTENICPESSTLTEFAAERAEIRRKKRKR